MGCREVIGLNLQLTLVRESDAVHRILYDEFSSEFSWILACQKDAMRVFVEQSPDGVQVS